MTFFDKTGLATEISPWFSSLVTTSGWSLVRMQSLRGDASDFRIELREPWLAEAMIDGGRRREVTVAGNLRQPA